MLTRPLRAMAALGALGALLFACMRGPTFESRTLYVYAPKACLVDQSKAYSVVYAGGDFEPSQDRPPIAQLYLDQVGAILSDLPSLTRSVVVDVSEPARTIDWRGIAEVPASGDVNVLVWPGGESCSLTRNVERRTDMTLGAFGHHVMVVGGKSLDGDQVPRTYVGDLSTGTLEALGLGLGTRRSRPTVTAFRKDPDEVPSPALVAGGEDPDTGTPLDTAEVYVPKPGAPGDLGDFDRSVARIQLSDARSKHGATVLSNGSTLLVGGIGKGGAPIRTMETLDPVTLTSRSDGLALLAFARANPTVLRLATGEILVAGGTDVRGTAVTALEWFSQDVTRATKRPVELVAGRERAFVPLEAGGALAVIAPDDASPDFKTVWIISAEGSLEAGVPVDPAELDTVRLFPGAAGSPVLWTGRRWLRWQPWFGAFQPIAEAPSTGPSSEAIASGDTGLALWLEDRGTAGMYVTGYRFDTRTRFDAVPKPLLVDGPGGLVPDRLAGQPGSSIRFDVGAGLTLGPGASAFVTDVTLADFDASLDVVGAAPELVLRQEDGRELEVGGAACAFAAVAQRKLAVARVGPRVTVRMDDGLPRACPTELDKTARVSIGLRGATGVGVSGARALVVTRH